MRDTFIAVDASTDLRRHARALYRLWDAAFSAGLDCADVRPVIAQSWSRLSRAGLDPQRLRPQVALPTAALEDVRATSPLRHVMPLLRGCLGTVADDAEHVVVVTDAAGRILWLEGHPRVLDTALNIDFAPGMLWTEHSAGTNAIGTALAIDHAVQIFSAEHFLPEQHAWWCSAAPIRDPATGQLLGVVDLSGPQRTAHPHSLALVSAAAQMAEDLLRHRRQPEPAPLTADTGRLRVHLQVTGRHRRSIRLDAGEPTQLSLRHAEALVLLALHPEGLNAEQLTLHLYGDAGNEVTTRALMSRLRGLVGGHLEARPYRLRPPVVADFLSAADLLDAGDVAGALAVCPGPLLADSQVPRIEEARAELDGALRRAVMRAGPELLWTWLHSEHGRQDPAALAAFVEQAGRHDPRRPGVEARLRVLEDSWGLTPEPAQA